MKQSLHYRTFDVTRVCGTSAAPTGVSTSGAGMGTNSVSPQCLPAACHSLTGDTGRSCGMAKSLDPFAAGFSFMGAGSRAAPSACARMREI
jgi:hypothetical protein